MNVDTLARGVELAVRPQASRLGLKTDRVVAHYVPNAGGFVNHSFRLEDGAVRVHLKLARSPDEPADLERWYRLRSVLSERYRAPRALAWVDLEELRLSGIAFEFVDGRVPERWDEVPAGVVAELLANLHRDAELARALDTLPRRTLARVFLDTYARRYREDLQGLAGGPPPFLDRARWAWLDAESRSLAEAVVRDPAFGEQATAPTHGDVWLNNVLLGERGIHLLDWDELAIGDPAMDLGMLSGPTADDLRRREDLPDLDLDEACAARVRWYHRAALLDWTIDTLADWCEAERWLADPRAFRHRHRAVHERAYAAYRELYG